MSKHRYIDRICCVCLSLMLILTIVFMNGSALGIQAASRSSLGYEDKLFDSSRVHTIDIQMDDWDGFIESCENEEYSLCTVVIDNEAYKKVGIRAKGNTSLSSVSAYGNGRYSFKVEFDRYIDNKTYYGLDKLSLNNIIQDNTYMKDYLSYQMMSYFGVDSPLCSYVYITVNGEDWGFYLAVEGVEDSFLERNYGDDYGELYKPDSVSMGGGRGNGDGFNMDDFKDNQNGEDSTQENSQNQQGNQSGQSTPQQGFPQGGLQRPDGNFPGGTPPWQQDGGTTPPDNWGGNMPGNGNMGGVKGSSDVSLIYSDDDYDSYSNIFDNAKTDISSGDKERLIASLKKLNENSDIEDIVDVDEVIRYFVVHNFVVNFDSYTGSMIHNYYLYEKDGQLSMIPWDYNLAFGGFQSSDATSLVNYPIDTPVSGGTVDSRPMLAWIFNNEEYTELYHQYFQEFITSYFDSGYFEKEITSVGEMISPYVEKDPTKFCTYEEFETGISTLKEFCLLRAESVNGQLNGTIPSTSDGQKADTSSLIDASSITITDMGSMGKGMGPGGMNGNQGQTGGTQGTGNSAPSQQTPPGGNSGENTGQQGTFPQPGQGNSQQQENQPGQSTPQQGFPQGGFPQGGMQRPDGNDSGRNPSGQQGGGGFPGNPQGMPEDMPGETGGLDSNTLLLLGSSILVLSGGLVFAVLYKRRRG